MVILPGTGTLKGAASFKDDVAGKLTTPCCEDLLFLSTYLTFDDWNKK